MRLQTARAIYRDGRLVFASPELTPSDGAEVVVTYLGEPQERDVPQDDPVQALRGRGKGERLNERLLRSRRENRGADGRRARHLRS